MTLRAQLFLKSIVTQKGNTLFSIFKPKIIYIRVKENTFILKSIPDGKTVTVRADTPFSNKRLLVAEFTEASKVLKSGMQQLGKFSLIAPIVIIHPLENIDDTLSEVEEKSLKELALSAGARKAKLWIGEELTDEDLSNV